MVHEQPRVESQLKQESYWQVIYKTFCIFYECFLLAWLYGCFLLFLKSPFLMLLAYSICFLKVWRLGPSCLEPLHFFYLLTTDFIQTSFFLHTNRLVGLVHFKWYVGPQPNPLKDNENLFFLNCHLLLSSRSIYTVELYIHNISPLFTLYSLLLAFPVKYSSLLLRRSALTPLRICTPG